MSDRIAYYVRTSTAKQQTGGDSQLGEIREWFDSHDHSFQDADEYVDLERSGRNLEREHFLQLVEAVKNDEYDAVVMTEISRIARILSASADFIDAAVDTTTTVYLTDEMIDCIDPTNQMTAFFAKQLALWYEEEAKQARRRSLRGRREAIRAGKWDRRPPLGFRVNTKGYLESVVEPRNRDDGVEETAYLTVVAALERIDEGDSYRAVANGSGLNRVTLMDIYKNEERRAWYLAGEAEDDRVQKTLDSTAV